MYVTGHSSVLARVHRHIKANKNSMAAQFSRLVDVASLKRKHLSPLCFFYISILEKEGPKSQVITGQNI